MNLVVIAVLLLCGVAPRSEAAAPTSSLPPLEISPELPSLPTAAVATAPAVRVTTTTEAPFDCASYVNSLPYEWRASGPMPDTLHDAYRVTAQCIGWSLETIDDWEAFVVEDIIANESGGCWNLKGGALVAQAAGCVLKQQGTKSDSGFGQLIAIWWNGPGTVVCDRLGLCSSSDIVASPWNSMRALLVAVEHDGRGPWCYDARARRVHPGCSSVSRYWP